MPVWTFHWLVSETDLSKSCPAKVTVLSAAFYYALNVAQNERHNSHSCYYCCEVFFLLHQLHLLSFFPFLRPRKASQEATYCNCCNCYNCFWCWKSNFQGQRPKLAKMCQVSGLLLRWGKCLFPQPPNHRWQLKSSGDFYFYVSFLSTLPCLHRIFL